MKTTFPEIVEIGRIRSGEFATDHGENQGAFRLVHGRASFVVIMSCGAGWEHVSVRASDYKGSRVPTWSEMAWIKDLFWGPEEAVMQLHPPASNYINHHPHVLHLWRPIDQPIPLPPAIMV